MKQALSLGTISVANILVAILVQWYIVVTIGPGMQTDALYASVAVPQFLLAVISSSLMQVLVPFLAGEREERIRSDAWGILILITGLFSLLAILGGLCAPLWVPRLLPGFSDAGRALTIALSRIQLAGMVFMALSSVLVAVCQARRRFIWPMVASLLGDLVGLGILLVTLKQYGIAVAAWLSVLSTALQTALLLPLLGRFQHPIWENSSLQEVWGRIKPLLLGSTYYKTDPLVDRFLSSMGAQGGLSLLYLGQQCYGVFNQVIGKALAVPLLPALAARAKAGNWRDFEVLYRKRLIWVTGLTGTAYAVLLLFGKSALSLVIGHGAVTRENVTLLWQVMVALVGLFVGGGIAAITTTAFYAIGDTRTLTRVGIYTYTIYIPLKVLAFIKFGLTGLAVAVSCFFLTNLIMQFYLLRRFIIRRLKHETE
jgi:putative peptidoglycan lipid II flippase